MKNIDLCGIGNSLVDIQYEVSENELKELQIAKGEMRLVEADVQQDIIRKLKSKTPHKSSGGSAANTIIAFSQFGGKAAYMSKLGDDDFGNFYFNEFEDFGIILYSDRIKNDPTGTCLILITPDSERSMLTCLGASAKFGKVDLSNDLIEKSSWIYIEGYKFSQGSSSEAVFKAIEIAKKFNTKISLTFSDVFIIENFHEKISRAVKESDLIFCNEFEALNYTGSSGIEQAIKILDDECPNYAITRGKNGAIVKWGNRLYEIPAYPVTAVDSTGAGDMFAAGFFYGLINSGSPETAGKLGSYAASVVVSQLGARLNTGYSKIKEAILKK